MHSQTEPGNEEELAGASGIYCVMNLCLDAAPMKPPHLTFFVELPSEPLATLFAQPGVMECLVHGGHALSMGLLDLTPVRGAIVRQLEAAGVAVTAWLLLDVADGYWLNADNPERARERYHQTIEWAAREGLRLHRVGLDIEFPRADADLIAREPRRGLLTLLRRRRTAAQVAVAEQAYAALVAEIRAGGRSVESYHFPHLLDERLARSTLLRRTLGLVDVSADAEVFMLYSSYLGRAGAHAYFTDAACIALGVTGGGVNAGKPEELPRLLSWERLEAELLAAVMYTNEVYVFSLEGCVERGMLDRLASVDWSRARDVVVPAEQQRGRRRRALFRGVLRLEGAIDVILPSRGRAKRETRNVKRKT